LLPPKSPAFDKDLQHLLPSTSWEKVKAVLIDIAPNTGYFWVGALAGIASRTTTAPLDRLKVYLIAQTGSNTKVLDAAKKGAPVQLVKGFWGSLANASKELWAAGGIRSLFAGEIPADSRGMSSVSPGNTNFPLDLGPCGRADLTLLTGNGINVVKVAPESAIRFGAYEVRPRYQRPRSTSPPPSFAPERQLSSP